MKIRADQMKAFEREAWRRFELEMVAHSKSFSPRLTAVLGEEQLLVALRDAMARAWSYGFTNRGPIRLYIELALLCGSGFDSDPQYGRFGDVLRAQADQMERAETLHELHNAYLETVSGADAVHEREALRELVLFLELPPPFSATDLIAELCSEFERIFPRKAQYVGQAGNVRLIEEAGRVAAANGFQEVRHIALFAALFFAFGYACTSDPFYPLIANILQAERRPDSAARAQQLERQAVAHLKQALHSAKRGAES